jgi:hypothetical protein
VKGEWAPARVADRLPRPSASGSRQTLRTRRSICWDNSAPPRATQRPPALRPPLTGSPWQPVLPLPHPHRNPVNPPPNTPAAKPLPAPTRAPPPRSKLRQTQAEYVAARPAGEPGVKPMMSSSKMYVCRRCQANFKTGDGKPDSRLPGLGKCNKCLAAAAASALPPKPPVRPPSPCRRASPAARSHAGRRNRA